ncbi:MAG TPA: hypothetical protein VMJ32_17895 [Pirellulales bacterium]|nr:hypothetical protein [Pirellulales bacterium]
MQRTLCSTLMTGLALTIVISMSSSSNADAPLTLQQQARLVTAASEQQAQAAISALRAVGPAGLQALVEEYRRAIDQHVSTPSATTAAPQVAPVASDSSWQRVKAALDAVGGQYDCYTSRLYWYTDWDAAQAAAKQSGKPILSLRLLGKLTDEFSCANSRFFRTTLYANDEVNSALRERFVLYWQTVRPVPKVTIDFGDGRKLERTLTGNSIHYILDSEGRPIDALPGLYGPQAFLRGLEAAEAAFAATKSMEDFQRTDYLRQYHQTQADQIAARWNTDLEQLGLLKPDPTACAVHSAPVDALVALTDDAAWGRIAQLHAADAQLDAASRALIAAQNPSAARAMPLAVTKAVVENPLLRLVRAFQNTLAIDSVRNEYTFHRQIHEWFAGGQTPVDIDANQLNEMVYAQLFLTPSNDPWLGLLTGDAYSALDNNGLCQK